MTTRIHGLTTKEMVSVLDNPKFLSATEKFYDESRKTNERYPTQQKWEKNWPTFCESVLLPFIRKWRVLPPPLELTYKKDNQQKVIMHLLTGKWGCVAIFPWSTKKEINQRIRSIRKAIGRPHKDASVMRKALIAQWLRLHENPSPPRMPSRVEIAQVVWNRQSGLKRLTKKQAMRKLSEEREVELMKRFRSQGLSYQQASQRLYRRAKGGESKAATMVRMAEKRLEQEQQRQNKELENPGRYDDMAYYLTLLLRELFSRRPVLKAAKWKGSFLRDYLISSNA